MSNSTSLKFNKAIPRLITLIILSIVMLFSNLSDNITTYAAGGSMDGKINPGGGPVSSCGGNFGASFSGYYFWVQDIDDPYGITASYVFFINYQNSGEHPFVASEIQAFDRSNRFGIPFTTMLNYSDLVPSMKAIKSPATMSGAELKEVLLSPASTGNTLAYEIISTSWPERLDDFNAGKNCLVFESVWWDNYYTNRSGNWPNEQGTRYTFGGTCYSWANYIFKPLGYAQTTKRFTHKQRPETIGLENDGNTYCGMVYSSSDASGYYTTEQMASKGLGIGIGVVFNGEGGGIDTYDGNYITFEGLFFCLNLDEYNILNVKIANCQNKRTLKSKNCQLPK